MAASGRCKISRERIGGDITLPHKEADPTAIATTTRTLLSKSLNVEDAIQVALLNNRNLQAVYELSLIHI